MKKTHMTIPTLLVIAIGIFSFTTFKANAITTVFVQPITTTVELFQLFQINISISQVTDLAAWDFKLYYPSARLNATNLSEGPFLKQAGSTSFLITQFTDHYNATHGRIWAACTLIGQGSGAIGSGTLARITLKAIGGGQATLHLTETELLDSQMPPDHISHTTADGIVQIPAVDIAITTIRHSKEIAGQHWSTHCHINVTIQNQGAETATFNLSIYASAALIGLVNNISIESGNSKIINITWSNIYGYAKGNYTIRANITHLPGEVDVSDNTLSDGWIFITIAGDCNGDRTVNVLDLILISNHLGHTNCDGHVPYSKDWYRCMNTDILDDNAHNVLDLIVASSHLGESW
jgi:hypothetical protein